MTNKVIQGHYSGFSNLKGLKHFAVLLLS